MKEEDLWKLVPLKNGTEIEAAHGVGCLKALRRLLERDPQHFRALLAIALGKSENIQRKSILSLQRLGFLERGQIETGLRNVLVSAYHESATGEGPVLVNPFRLAEARDAESLEQIDEAHEQFKRKVLERIRQEREEGGRSP